MARTTTVHLLTGDYPDRLDKMLREAEAAAKSNIPRTAIDDAKMDEDYAALKAEAIEAGTTVELEAVGRKTWRALKEKYPPRVGDDVDKEIANSDRLAGVNTDAVEDPLVYASLAAPKFTSLPAFDEWADRLSEGEWQVLVIKAWELANGARLDPKDHLPSRTRSDG